jgi:hypothetical protein
MRKMMVLGAAALMLLGACGGSGRGVQGAIGRACLAGDRDAATPALCSCIQGAADQTLTGAEQRRAAGFFSDPQEAQDTRQSDRRGDEAFWDRYQNFVDRARAVCG